MAATNLFQPEGKATSSLNSKQENENTASKKEKPHWRTMVGLDERISFKCSLIQRKAIEFKARSAGLTVAGYIRKVCPTGAVYVKTLPPEVLMLTGALNQLAAELNQIALKRISNEDLNALERATMKQLGQEVYQLVKTLKSHLQCSQK